MRHLTVQQAASLRGVTPQAIRKAITKHGPVLGFKVNGNWRVNPITLERLRTGLPISETPSRADISRWLRQAADGNDRGDDVTFSCCVARVIAELSCANRIGKVVEGTTDGRA